MGMIGSTMTLSGSIVNDSQYRSVYIRMNEYQSRKRLGYLMARWEKQDQRQAEDRDAC